MNFDESHLVSVNSNNTIHIPRAKSAQQIQFETQFEIQFALYDILSANSFSQLSQKTGDSSQLFFADGKQKFAKEL